MLSLLPRNSRVIQSFRDYRAIRPPRGCTSSHVADGVRSRLRRDIGTGGVVEAAPKSAASFRRCRRSEISPGSLIGSCSPEGSFADERWRLSSGMMDAVAARRELLIVPFDVAALIR
jgi:hypothetical protein